MSEGLPMWVIYDSPRDHPGRFVARLWINDRPTDQVRFATRINDLRNRFMREGLVKLMRATSDHPSILETWL